MHKSLKTERFSVSYTESTVESALLWESHCHAQFEMIAVLEGDVIVMPEGGCFSPAPLQCVIVPPLTYHTVTANSRGVYRRITAQFDAAAIPAVLRPCFEGGGLRAAADVSRQLLALQKLCDAEQTAFYAPLIDSLMTEILYEGVAAATVDTLAAPSATLRQMLNYIDAHLSDPLCLDGLAAHFACSKSTLCHLFRAQMRTSPKQYILQKRLALAEWLIRDGVPATTASTRSGFENYSNFYRMYRKHFGRSPKDMQKSPKTV